MAEGYDLSKVLQQAAGAAQEAEEKEASFGKHRLVYPQNGIIHLRLLFNPAAGIVLRKIDRHKVDTVNDKSPCLEMYGQECPICKAVTNIENAINLQDSWKIKRAVRGLFYAQYVRSDYQWSNDNKEPAVGEVVLVMCPQQVYSQISQVINEAGEKIYDIVAKNEGMVFKINRYKENNQIRYRAELDALNGPYRSSETDEAFKQLLDSLPDLNESIHPSKITDNIIKKARDIGEKMIQFYLAGSMMQQSQPVNLGQVGYAGGYPQQQGYAPQPQGGYPMQQGYTPQQGYPQQGGYPQNPPPVPPQNTVPPPVPPQNPQQSSETPPPNPEGSQTQNPAGASPDAPACFGTHAESSAKDAKRCMLCPRELNCKEESSKK